MAMTVFHLLNAKFFETLVIVMLNVIVLSYKVFMTEFLAWNFSLNKLTLLDCENLLKKFLVLNPEKRAPLEVNNALVDF